MAPHSSTLAWRIPWTAVHGVAKSRTRLSDFTFTFHLHALEKEMATHSSVLAWRIPGTGEPGGLLSMGSHRVGHNWSDFTAAAAAAFHCVHWAQFVYSSHLLTEVWFEPSLSRCRSQLKYLSKITSLMNSQKATLQEVSGWIGPCWEVQKSTFIPSSP